MVSALLEKANSARGMLLSPAKSRVSVTRAKRGIASSRLSREGFRTSL